jgi:hypothetical protein
MLSKPTITNYSPSNIAPASHGDEVKIAVDGFKLCLGDGVHIPRLKIADRVYL